MTKCRCHAVLLGVVTLSTIAVAQAALAAEASPDSWVPAGQRASKVVNVPPVKLPKLGKGNDYCAPPYDEDTDSCFRPYVVDLNGDGIDDLLVVYFFTGNDETMNDKTVWLFLSTPEGYKQVLKTKTVIGNGLYIFGDPKCRNLGEWDGQIKKSGKRWFWECKDGQYSSKPKPWSAPRK